MSFTLALFMSESIITAHGVARDPLVALICFAAFAAAAHRLRGGALGVFMCRSRAVCSAARRGRCESRVALETEMLTLFCMDLCTDVADYTLIRYSIVFIEFASASAHSGVDALVRTATLHVAPVLWLCAVHFASSKRVA